MCDARDDPAFPPEAADACGNGSPISADDLAAAMREDRPGDAFILTPAKLSADRSMPDQSLPTPSQQRPNNGRTIADVDIYPA